MPRGAALLFMDWTILRMFPPLRMAWGFRGRQVRVPITGYNAKRVLFGTVDVRTGHRVVLRRTAAREADFQAFLRELRRRYRRRPVWLLLDRAPCQTTPGSQALAGRLDVTLVWLPKQASELNGMDQLWKELKKAISANRQYDTVDEHADHAERWLLGLSTTEARRKAGILSPHFWLRHLSENFWLPT
jgi:transposase